MITASALPFDGLTITSNVGYFVVCFQRRCTLETRWYKLYGRNTLSCTVRILSRIVLGIKNIGIEPSSNNAVSFYLTVESTSSHLPTLWDLYAMKSD
jgi:hypothetical protein